MANIVFNSALGKVKGYAEQVGVGNAALVVVPLAASGLDTDAALRDCADLAAVLAGSTNEQTSMGRKTVTACTIAVDNATDVVTVDIADLTWTAAAGAAVGAFLIGFDADTTVGTDVNIVPLTKHDMAFTPDGTDFVLTVAGFYRSSSVS